MKTLATIAIAILSLCALNATAQNCTSCTQMISGTNASSITANPGDVICITSTGSQQGAVFIDGGVVCNDGEVVAAIFITAGEFNNYGTVQGGAVQLTGGSYYNEGTVTMGQFLMDADSTIFENVGWMQMGQLLMNGTDPAVGPQGSNEGYISCTNLLNQGGFFENLDSLVVTGALEQNSNSEFENYAPLSIGGQWLNMDSYFYNECLVTVGGAWDNEGEVEGPTAVGSCGSFEVMGAAHNDGDLAVDNSFIDVCEINWINGMSDGPNAAQGTGVTECVCTGNCGGGTNSIAVYNTDDELLLYPNPAEDYITLSNAIATEYMIYDYSGKVVASGSMQSDAVRVDVSDYAAGIYIVVIGVVDRMGSSKKFVVR